MGNKTAVYTLFLLLMKKLIFLLSITLICLNVTTVLGQKDIEKVNNILAELENEGGKFKESDYERFSEIIDQLFSLSSEYIQAEMKNLAIEDLYQNETHFIWRIMDFDNNQMYLIITNKEFEEINSVKITFREAYLLNMALNDLQPDQLKTPE